MKAYVINLESRPKRKAEFLQHMGDAGLEKVFEFEFFTAINGQTLDLETMKHRVSESNWAQINRLRGHLGCTLSHLECWRRIASGSESIAIFEDDARIVSGIEPGMIRSAVERLPSHASLVWLNDYNYWARESLGLKIQRRVLQLLRIGVLAPRNVRFNAMPDVMTTMEAYILTPSGAQTLYEGLINSLGAVDRHVQLVVAKTGLRAVQSYPALFTQADRSDSSTLV